MATTTGGLWSTPAPAAARAPVRASAPSPPKNKKNKNTKNKKKDREVDISSLWLEVIHQAVHSVLSPRHCRDSSSGSRSPAAASTPSDHHDENNKIQKAEACMKYLLQLEAILIDQCERPASTQSQQPHQHHQQQHWNRPPKKRPPIFRGGTTATANTDNTTTNANTATTTAPSGQPAALLSPSFVTSNPFAAFGDDDDDEDDEDNDDEDPSASNYPVHDNIINNNTENDDIEDEDDEDEDNAGDTPVLHSIPMRRLLIRILTSQADVSSHLAFVYRQQQKQLQQQQQSPLDNSSNYYMLGAHACTVAVQKIYKALVLADSALSEWLSTKNDSSNNVNNNSNKTAEYDHLVEDSTIVGISVGHLVKERDTFLSLVQKESARLLRKLEPQWKSRDEIRSNWGPERWKNNPRPKFDHAQLRQQDEQMLRQVQEAEVVLRELDADGLQISSNDLRQRLEEAHHKNHRRRQSRQQQQQWGEEPSSQSSITRKQQPQQFYRYNGLRPNKNDDDNNNLDYPDPTLFGWTFTGSNEASRVEFFERSFETTINNATETADEVEVVVVVKLDWYYTTHTIKTALDHPKQGRTQLFASGRNNVVTPELYRQILVNPRQHTNVRYHTKGGKGGRSGRGGGPSARGGFGRGGRGTGGRGGRG